MCDPLYTLYYFEQSLSLNKLKAVFFLFVYLSIYLHIENNTWVRVNMKFLFECLTR